MDDKLPTLEPFVVFYSWQSDLPARTNRNLIESALERACKQLKKQSPWPVEVQVAARDAPGSPPVADLILQRIASCDALVADVSIIGEVSSTSGRARPTPNPNVLLETGFGASAIGWDRVLLVHNAETGTIEDLPFDIRGRHVLKYAPPPEAEGPAHARGQLADQLQAALGVVMTHGKHRPGLTWMRPEQRRYYLDRAAWELSRAPEILARFERGLAGAPQYVSLPTQHLATAPLQSCMEIAWVEFDIEDAVALQRGLDALESFNILAMRLPAGEVSPAIMPTIEALLNSAAATADWAALCLRIIEHAQSTARPRHGDRVARYPGPRPYTLPSEPPEAGAPRG